MSCAFKITKSDMQNKTIVMGYSPLHFNSPQTFFFSPIQILGAKQINYEVGTEYGVMLLLANFLCTNPTDKFQMILENIDIGYLSAETNIGEEEFIELTNFIDNDPVNIMLTQDFLLHPSNSSILAILLEISLENNISCFLPNLPFNTCDYLPETNGIVLRITQGIPSLQGSEQFAKFLHLSDGDCPTIMHQDFSIQAPFSTKKDLRGTIGILKIPHLFLKYPYQCVKIQND